MSPRASIFLLLSFLTSLLPACRGKEESSGIDPTAPLPGPARARAAAKRTRPELERALAAKNLRLGDPVFLRAFKEEALLELWVLQRASGRYQHFRTWSIAALSGGPGPKLAEGDRQVPEGFYYVPPSAMKPDSRFHLAFNIGYPNAYDRHHRRTGSHIMVHGDRVSIGCLAMTDERIEEIYTLCAAALDGGQPFFRIHLFPFRMNDERMARETKSEWFDFWQNLREGHDHFERLGLPPEVDINQGRYRFR
ncbi:MAG: 2-dehydro-3-deoxyphosphooctonate aldolase [Verrucomicrobia bacterium]|nr:MAG: 2-dehydro-3-deoxyphosphooctonate aldolase [Verrucomicrobiota bacterium]TAE87495.1 MAG: 2-dehydro-3-deoxyphosphooctonate aldolase [Verrucomicrobiota bacterium]TAF25777.1 MAG: 2-dehydro-3-deoxyphosphooctonate aldolase [Verrucomicrobiota bacterium]TAF41565.1 MAG: 2-dehydro-3-deoxyphosphooctonate aldolase [Verrucomicrobiota bacterium]